MSLINDALKRARQAQQKNEPPPAGAPLRPVEGRRGSSPNNALIPLVLAAALVIIGGILIVYAMTRGEPRALPRATSIAINPATTTPAPTAEKSSPPPAVEPVKPIPAPATSVAVPAPTVNPSPTPEAAAAASTTKNAETNAPAVAAAPIAPPPPLPKLQGISFHPTRPSAVVSGKTVYLDSHVGDYSVVAITARTVILTKGGETNVLSLEE